MTQATAPTKPKRTTKRKKNTTGETEKLLAQAFPYIPDILPAEDDEPLETDWHLMQIHLLLDLIRQLWHERNDFYAGGNTFVYYSAEQAQSVIQNRPLYKGPDFFIVKGVDGGKPRSYWNVWNEGGRFPDVIFELSSPSTARKDRVENVALYGRVFATPEYFICDPDKGELLGYRLTSRREYAPIAPDERGWLWSEQLEVWVGFWEGEYHGRVRRWVRWWTGEGELVPTPYEAQLARAEAERQRAEAERQRAEEERRRAEEATQRAEQLAQRLRELGIDPDLM